MKTYELVIVLPGSLEADARDNFYQKIKKIVDTVKAKVIKETNWGMRKLLYPVKKESVGYYFIFTLSMDEKAIKELQRLLNFETSLLRYLLLKV